MIGIIGAMEEEVAALKSEMADAKVTEFASMTFYKGTLCGKDTVVVRSGIGKVNAAICAQILVDKFGVDTLINTGIAGSLDARIDIGDMVISTDAVHHDMDATIFGDAIGQVPRMDTRTFPADPHLVELAVKANEKSKSADPYIYRKGRKWRSVHFFRRSESTYRGEFSGSLYRDGGRGNRARRLP